MSSDINTGKIELTLWAGFFKNKLVIDELGIEFKNRYVPFSQIESLRYGIWELSNKYEPATINYTFCFLESTQKKFTVYFSVQGNSYARAQQEEAAANYLVIINALRLINKGDNSGDKYLYY